MEDSKFIYGQITAYFDIVGFSFEKITPKLISLVKEKKWKELGFDTVNDFLRSLDKYWSRWRITAEQRKELAIALKEADNDVSQRAIADMAGVDEITIRRDTATNVAPVGKINTEYQEDINDTATNVVPPAPSGEQLVEKQQKEEKKEKKKKERVDDIEQQKKDIKEGKITIPEGIFKLIVIDPPWKYDREYDPAGSRVASPYPEMGFDELSKLELPTDNDCILWLWTTHSFIWDAKELMKIWGFDYKAILVWDKEKMGMGTWLRMQCEFCLLGIKGKPIWDIKTMPDIIRDKRKEHSRKPKIFYELIEDYFDFIPEYCDYFSREQFSNKWKQVGNYINKFKDGKQ